jgi:hypothetical protein
VCITRLSSPDGRVPGTNYDGDGAGGYSGTQNSGAPVPATAPTGNDPYFNKVNQEANLAHHDAGSAGDQYNPYHDSAGAVRLRYMCSSLMSIIQRWHKTSPHMTDPETLSSTRAGIAPLKSPDIIATTRFLGIQLRGRQAEGFLRSMCQLLAGLQPT